MFSKQLCTSVFRNRNFDRRLSKVLFKCNKNGSSTDSLQKLFHIVSVSRADTFAQNQRKYTRDGYKICSRAQVSFTKRTHLCGELSNANIGENVRLCGWVVYNRMVGMFLIIRDWTGMVQLTVPEDKDFLSKEISEIPFESVVEVHGKVTARPKGEENQNMSTGDIEVELSSINVLNKCRDTLPINLRDHIQTKESLRMEYRYLDIRSKQMQYNLRLRSSMIMKIREFLCNQHGFVDVETPTLFRRTPGGAREFVVPSRQHGKFYSLPQSPQQFKQLLMIGGIDRYYQIAKCYRDEGAKPDRQPEFTQVDIEMSFTDKHDVRSLIEKLLQYSWPSDKGSIDIPFSSMTYQQAMENYGTDKPDLRYDLKLERLTDLVQDSGVQFFEDVTQNSEGHVIGLRLPDGYKHLSKKEIEKLQVSAFPEKHVKTVMVKVSTIGEWKSPISKHLNTLTQEKIASQLKVQPGDLIVLATGSRYSPHMELGRIRTNFADILDRKGVTLRNKNQFDFLWVTDFPLFLPKEDGEELESAHHPFTAPHKDDLDLLYTNPEKVRSEHYDLVLNGNEIGGGSIRIHDSKLQRYVLQDILKEDVSELEHLLEALELGCPPHGGIALGLDRLLAIICRADSIRDVIAFPKTQEGKDLMSKSPSTISNEDLDLYHVQVKPLTSS